MISFVSIIKIYNIMSIPNFKTYKNRNNQNFHIFLDMDGVICDFHRAFVNVDKNSEGIPFDSYIDKYGLHNAWKLVSDEGIEWWSEMDWIHDGKILWEHVKKYDPTMLSAPSRDKLSGQGKIIWVNRELKLGIEEPILSPKPHRWDEDSRLILNSQKYLFCKRYPNSILIDDTPKKINDWIKSGGIGILHKDAHSTIKELEAIIKDIK